MTKNGMLIALIDEYKRSAIDLKKVLNNLSQATFEKINDINTTDPDCRSIQTITFHIIQSGYTYSNYINTITKKDWFEYSESIVTPLKGIEELDKMLGFAEHSFEGIWHKTNEEIELWKFKTRWNVTYDFEQLMEHAIVHVLRHRRQIENMIKDNL